MGKKLGCHILIFDEEIGDSFLGIPIYPRTDQMKEGAPQHIGEKPLISDLPLWASFKINDLIRQCYPDNAPMTIFSVQRKDATRRLIKLLTSGEIEERIMLGRTGNVTAIEWQNLENRLLLHTEPLKIQVGKIPSDLYLLKRSYLRRVLEQYEGDSVNIARWLFNTHLFYNFERIIDVPGFSFLMRDSYEYYRENMRIFDYLKSESFLDLYGKLFPSSLKNSSVLENGVVRESVLGCGVTVEGTVERSVIFNDVTVARHAVVKDSIILNSNVIEEDVRIRNTLLFEGNGRAVGRGSSIGNEEDIDNVHYPEIDKRGLTLIGPDIPIPAFSRIGAGCIVMSSVNPLDSPIILDNCEVFNTRTQKLGINALH